MQIRTSILTVKKRYPLTISRGTSAESTNLLVQVEHDGIVGMGEMAPVSIGYDPEDDETGRADFVRWNTFLEPRAPWEMQRIEERLNDVGGGRAARAALDMALYDWLGKRAGLPVYQLLGADRRAIVPTSVTIGINPPEVLRRRVPEILTRLGARALKIKLGSPDGIEADREMFSAVKESAPKGVALRVDANGGWDVAAAKLMIRWLAKRGVEFVEQPLALGQEADLPAVFRRSPLPIFADESCRVSGDIPKLAGRVHGINLKLMKSGGIREGLRVIHSARAHGLKVMMGCMSESSLAIAASAHISAFADYLDLDSHLNLMPDPFTGLTLDSGRVLPGNMPGLSISAAN